MAEGGNILKFWWFRELQYFGGMCSGLCGACCVNCGWCLSIWFGEHVVCCVPKSGDSSQLSCVRLCDGGM